MSPCQNLPSDTSINNYKFLCHSSSVFHVQSNWPTFSGSLEISKPTLSVNRPKATRSGPASAGLTKSTDSARSIRHWAKPGADWCRVRLVRCRVHLALDLSQEPRNIGRTPVGPNYGSTRRDYWQYKKSCAGAFSVCLLFKHRCQRGTGWFWRR